MSQQSYGRQPVSNPDPSPVVAEPPELQPSEPGAGSTGRCLATVTDAMATRGRTFQCELPRGHVGRHRATIPQPGEVIDGSISWSDDHAEHAEDVRLWNAIADDQVPHPDSVALAEAFVDGIRNDEQYDYGGWMDAGCLASASIDTRGLDLIAIADSIRKSGWRPPAQVITDPATPDTFPIRTAGVDRDGEVWVSGNAGWETIIGGGESLHDLVTDHGPLTIVHITEEARDGE